MSNPGSGTEFTAPALESKLGIARRKRPPPRPPTPLSRAACVGIGHLAQPTSLGGSLGEVKPQLFVWGRGIDSTPIVALQSAYDAEAVK